MYVDQVLKDEEAVFCKISNIQSKDFRMFTQYIFKKTLVNYENKRYWLDSIYSLPFPWIAKIENGTMKIEEAIAQLVGKVVYKYELSGYNKAIKQEEIKQETLKREEEIKAKVVSNEVVTVTNLNEKELNLISDSNGIKSGLNKLLNNAAGLKLFGKLLGAGKVKEHA